MQPLLPHGCPHAVVEQPLVLQPPGTQPGGGVFVGAAAGVAVGAANTQQLVLPVVLLVGQLPAKGGDPSPFIQTVVINDPPQFASQLKGFTLSQSVLHVPFILRLHPTPLSTTVVPEQV